MSDVPKGLLANVATARSSPRYVTFLAKIVIPAKDIVVENWAKN